MTATAPRLTPSIDRVPLSRLVRVEILKLVTTRATRGLLIAMAALTLAITIASVWLFEPTKISFASLATTAILPLSVLLPILGILTITGEWSHRTALVTFALQPARLRVIGAKAGAVTGVAVLLSVAALVFAALGTVARMLFRGGDGGWALDPLLVGGSVVALCLLMVQGLAFGMMFVNSALAIVLWYLLPLGYTTAVLTVPWLRPAAALTDLNVTLGPLAEGTMTATDVLPLLVSALLWIGLPLVFGILRTQKREVK